MSLNQRYIVDDNFIHNTFTIHHTDAHTHTSETLSTDRSIVEFCKDAQHRNHIRIVCIVAHNNLHIYAEDEIGFVGIFWLIFCSDNV